MFRRSSGIDEMDRKFEAGFERILQLREESMAQAREALSRLQSGVLSDLGQNLSQGFVGAMRASQGLASDLREELSRRSESLRAYIESEAFERDLDRLADRLEVDFGKSEEVTLEDRSARVRAKAARLFQHARKEVLRAAEKGGAFSFISPIARRPRVVLSIALLCGGIKSAEILMECYHVFLPALRRRGLHVV